MAIISKSSMPQFSCPEELEQKYVHEVYNDIAPGFRHTRYKAWPFVEQFLKSQSPGSIIADVGCGSGKYLGLSPNTFVMGSDSCLKLLEIAHERQHEVSVSNNLKLPFKDKCFDAVISIGVIHHLASNKRRLKALQELGRILRPGGKMLVYVWAMEQNHRKFDAQDVLVPYTGHRVKGKHWKTFHQKSCDSYFLSTSHKVPYKNGLKRSRSCDCLFDRSSSGPNIGTDFESNSTRTKDSIVSSNLEFKALKEIVQILKNKKDHLLTNINSKVMKLYPEKEKRFVNEVISAVVGRIFDKNNDSDMKIKEGNPASKRVSNITEFVSSLVKRLFGDKNQQAHLNIEVSNVSSDGKRDDALQISEDALKESIYENLTAWAREKMALLSRDLHGSPLFARVKLLREDSCNSECSEPDIDADSAPAYILAVNQDTPKRETITENSAPLKSPRIVDASSSSDTDSDGVDLVNSDSGISDTDVPSNKRDVFQPHLVHDETIVRATEKKKPTLQRYYHVFSAKELPDLIEDSVDGVNVLKEFYDHGNWAVIAEKQ